MTAVTVTYVASTSVGVTVTEPTIEVTVALSGAAGPANTITIGTVTTLPVGSLATAGFRGTPPAQILDLGLPTGATGLTGDRGPTGPQGDWSAAQQINPQTGTAYTLMASDAGKLVTLTNSLAITLTVPAGLGLAIGQRIDLAAMGTGQVTVTPGSASTFVRYTPSLKLRAQYSAATLICTGVTTTPTVTETYLLVGDLAAT